MPCPSALARRVELASEAGSRAIGLVERVNYHCRVGLRGLYRRCRRDQRSRRTSRRSSRRAVAATMAGSRTRSGRARSKRSLCAEICRARYISRGTEQGTETMAEEEETNRDARATISTEALRPLAVPAICRCRSLARDSREVRDAAESTASHARCSTRRCMRKRERREGRREGGPIAVRRAGSESVARCRVRGELLHARAGSV